MGDTPAVMLDFLEYSDIKKSQDTQKQLLDTFSIESSIEVHITSHKVKIVDQKAKVQFYLDVNIVDGSSKHQIKCAKTYNDFKLLHNTITHTFIADYFTTELIPAFPSKLSNYGGKLSSQEL